MSKTPLKNNPNDLPQDHFKITVNKNHCERKFRWGWVTNCLKPCLMDRYTYNKFHH